MLSESINYEINNIWTPVPDSSQVYAMRSEADHTLMCGSRGGGKTDTQLMAFAKGVGQGYGPFYRGIILDREYKNLDDLISKSRRWFSKMPGARFLSSTSALKWIWPTGEELLFRSADKVEDYWQFHGHEYPFIGWNELTKYPSSDLYDMFMSTNRTSFDPVEQPIYVNGRVFDETNGRVKLHVHKSHMHAVAKIIPPLTLRVFSTTNPYGPGHNWVKRRFIDPAPYGKVLKTNISVIDPKTQEKAVVVKSQVAIFSSFVENKHLTKEYIATLTTEKDPNRRKAWLTGSWDIVAGGALDDVWNKNYHVIPRFAIPPSWKIDRAYDDGSSHPFAVGWFAEADGTEADVLVNGEWTKFCPQPRSLIQFFEWYGSEIDEATNQPSIGTNKGLKLSARKIALGIIDRETSLAVNGWISQKVSPGPADNRIRNVIDKELSTVEDLMFKQGVSWESSDKSPGSRIVGLQLVRDRLDAALPGGEGPALYFMDCCRATIATLPVLPRDAKKLDDVDTTAEDHAYDMVRYRVLKGSNRYATSVKMTMPT